MKSAFGISIFLVQTPEDLSDPMFFLGLLSGYGFSWTHERPSSYHRRTKSGGCPGRPSSSFSAPFDPRRSQTTRAVERLVRPRTDLPEHPLVARFLNNIAIVASATAPISAKRRRVNVCALARRSDNGSGAVPPHPFGPMGLRPNSLSLVVADVNTSTPPRFAISARKPHRRLLCYLGNEPLEPLLNDWIRSIVTLRGLRVFPESKH